MIPRLAALLLCLALWFAAATDYIPTFLDAQGKVFGLFKLDIYKDALHVASGLWALVAAIMSRRAATLFLKIFGTLYFLDGVMGTFTGSGFLDLSIITQGVLNNPPLIKLFSSVPHLFLGAFGIIAGWFGERLLIGARN
ncbi:DUF4383 domain-containing protein [Methylocapsa sp. S129]|uniref:DUF4383 domain-containing protein n=1 Tax=Methylocapsa sp. S129 TaxID=1641869 RepID=UPI00131C0DDA|nr:DUF4383 domain-containing protein [Methylocapsa sp. S129]